jgi:thymidylate synthase (FAD)
MTHTVKLVSITPDAEELVAYCARVSNPNNQTNHETAPRLLKYLIKHKHWSPFEMANMVVEINTTRAVAAQILRHRSFSFQEFSQRYADSNELGKPVMPQLRLQDYKNRQNSITPDEEDVFLKSEVECLYRHAMDVYGKLLDNGVAKECARDVLPMAIPSRLYMNGTIRSWLHYVDLRAGPETQLEHRMIAEGVKDLLEKHCPSIYEAMWT